MRKKIMGIAGLSLCLCLLAGCSKQSEVKHIDEAQVSETNTLTDEKENALKVKTVKPLPALYTEKASDNMPDGVYPVCLKTGNIKRTENGYAIKLEFFDYDRYDKEEVDNLKKGDSIRVLGKDVVVESIDPMPINHADFHGININGGIDEEGITLFQDDEEYRTAIYNDYPMYYSIGTGTVPVSRKLSVEDYIDYENHPDGVVTRYKDFPDNIEKAEGDYWDQYNTSVTISSGKIVKIKRIWTP